MRKCLVLLSVIIAMLLTSFSVIGSNNYPGLPDLYFINFEFQGQEGSRDVYYYCGPLEKWHPVANNETRVDLITSGISKTDYLEYSVNDNNDTAMLWDDKDVTDSNHMIRYVLEYPWDNHVYLNHWYSSHKWVYHDDDTFKIGWLDDDSFGGRSYPVDNERIVGDATFYQNGSVKVTHGDILGFSGDDWTTWVNPNLDMSKWFGVRMTYGDIGNFTLTFYEFDGAGGVTGKGSFGPYPCFYHDNSQSRTLLVNVMYVSTNDSHYDDYQHFQWSDTEDWMIYGNLTAPRSEGQQTFTVDYNPNDLDYVVDEWLSVTMTSSTASQWWTNPIAYFELVSPNNGVVLSGQFVDYDSFNWKFRDFHGNGTFYLRIRDLIGTWNDDNVYNQSLTVGGAYGGNNTYYVRSLVDIAYSGMYIGCEFRAPKDELVYVKLHKQFSPAGSTSNMQPFYGTGSGTATGNIFRIPSTDAIAENWVFDLFDQNGNWRASDTFIVTKNAQPYELDISKKFFKVDEVVTFSGFVPAQSFYTIWIVDDDSESHNVINGFNMYEMGDRVDLIDIPNGGSFSGVKWSWSESGNYSAWIGDYSGVVSEKLVEFYIDVNFWKTEAGAEQIGYTIGFIVVLAVGVLFGVMSQSGVGAAFGGLTTGMFLSYPGIYYSMFPQEFLFLFGFGMVILLMSMLYGR